MKPKMRIKIVKNMETEKFLLWACPPAAVGLYFRAAPASRNSAPKTEPRIRFLCLRPSGHYPSRYQNDSDMFFRELGMDNRDTYLQTSTKTVHEILDLHKNDTPKIPARFRSECGGSRP
jgi:hypothetical protein